MTAKPALVRGLALAASLTLASCGGGGSEPTNAGVLELEVVTSGADLDGDGYTASIDGSSPTVVGTNQPRTLTLPTGEHSILIGGVAANCELSETNPRSVTITAGNTTPLSITVVCRPTMTGRWALSVGVIDAGFGVCSVSDIALDIVEKHNPDQPVDSLLGRYSGGEGTCPYRSPGSAILNYPVSYPLDSLLFGIIDRHAVPGTSLTIHFGDDPRRGTLGASPDADSLVISLFTFLQDPTGHVVRSIAAARRQRQ